MSDITTTNRMTARQLKESQGNAPIDIVKNPHTGKLFFTCGSKRGYVSPNAATKLADANSTLDDFQYAEVSIDGNEAVPCFMIASKANVQRSL